MSKVKFFRGLAFAVFILNCGILIGFAQKTDKNKPSQNPEVNPRKVRSEMRNAHTKWLAEDVPYIITKAEKDAFLLLKSDEERENFIAIFWQNRDPNTDTEENEYREEYYERIAYANEHFASGKPGWKTDRGRIYIAWGKPDSVESRPSGGSYDRPSYEGGGSTTTYPFETWFYRHLDNVGDGVEIEFVDPTGTGEYRIARNADEKDALVTVPGAGAKTNIGEARNYQREQDSQFAVMRKITALETPPVVKFGDLQRSLTDTPIIDNNPLEFDLRVGFFRLSDDRVVTTFTVQTDNKELKFESIGGMETAKINIFGRITALSGKRSGIFEDSVTANTNAQDLAELKEGKSIYQKAVALQPGTYKVGVVVRDTVTGNRGIVNLGFTVPKYDAKKLSTSSLVLASKLRGTDHNDVGGQFVIGNTKVIPNLNGIYKKGAEVGIYLQIYNSGIDQITLRPAVDVEYLLIKSGEVIYRQNEDWSGLSDSGQRLTLARLLPTSQLARGEYEIKIVTKDRVNGEVVENTGSFTIKQ